MRLESDSLAALPVGEVFAEFPLHESLTFYTWVTIGCPVSGPGVRADEPQRRDDVAVSVPVVAQRRDDVVPYLVGRGDCQGIPVYAHRSSPLSRELARHRHLARLGAARRCAETFEAHAEACRSLAGHLISGRESFE